MAYKNYSKISSKKRADRTNKSETTYVTDTDQPRDDELGSVFNCERLNIRATPSVMAEVLDIVNKGTKVRVNESTSTPGFYSVTVRYPDGSILDGYAMRKYIKLDR